MDFQNNNKYFNVNNTPVYVGLGFLATGIICLIINFVLSNSFFLVLAIVLAIIAALVFIFGTSGRISDADIDKQIKRKTLEIDRDAKEKFNLDDNDIKILAPYMVASYEFSEASGANAIKGKDNKYRSSVYASTVLFYSGECIYVYTKRFSILDPKLDELNAYTVIYTNIANVELVTNEYSIVKGGKKLTLKNHYIDITLEDGSVQKILALNDADADNAVANIKRLSERAKKKAEELSKS